MDLTDAEPARADELRGVLRRSSWFEGVLRDVGDVGPPRGWVGAGVIRNIVWDTRFGDGFAPERVKDVDVAYFDPEQLNLDRDAELERALEARAPEIHWDVKNQAAVHLWYAKKFGFAVPPAVSIADAVATWPEYATCVAVRSGEGDSIDVCAPYGLDDLLDGVWRHNPRRAPRDEYLRRLEAKAPASRWPSIRIIL